MRIPIPEIEQLFADARVGKSSTNAPDRPGCPQSGTAEMSIKDKLENMAEDVVGKAKEMLGKVSGDQHLQAEGQADQASSNVKQAGEHLKDAAKKVAGK